MLKGPEYGNIGRQVTMCNLVRKHVTDTPGNCEQFGELRTGNVEDTTLLGEVSLLCNVLHLLQRGIVCVHFNLFTPVPGF